MISRDVVTHKDVHENLIEFIKQTRSSATDKTYNQAQGKYEQFALARGWKPYDQDRSNFAIQVAAYTKELGTSHRAAATIKTAAAAVSSEFGLQTGHQGVLGLPLVKQTLRAAQKHTGNKKDHSKKPLQKAHLELIVARAYERMLEMDKGRKGGHKFTIIRDVTVLLVMYYGCLRVGEATNLTRADVEDVTLQAKDGEQPASGIQLLIGTSKTNQTGEQKKTQRVTILRNARPDVCAVKWLAEYKKATPDQRPTAPLFQAESGGKMAEDSVRKLVKKWTEEIGLDPKQYSSHSMRKGAATDANAAGTSIDDIRQHGRWARNSTAVHTYIALSDEEKFQMALFLAGKK